MNGDVLTTLDYARAGRLPPRAGRGADDRHAPPSEVKIDLGVIDTEGGLRHGLPSRSRRSTTTSAWASTSTSQRALAHLPEGPCQFPDLVLRLLDGGRAASPRSASDADWYDIGTLSRVRARDRATSRRTPEAFGMGQARRAPSRAGGPAGRSTRGTRASAASRPRAGSPPRTRGRRGAAARARGVVEQQRDDRLGGVVRAAGDDEARLAVDLGQVAALARARPACPSPSPPARPSAAPPSATAARTRGALEHAELLLQRDEAAELDGRRRCRARRRSPRAARW